jgi:hypothetical protein
MLITLCHEEKERTKKEVHVFIFYQELAGEKDGGEGKRCYTSLPLPPD